MSYAIRRKTVVEGHRTTEALYGLCRERGIVAPIMAEVYAILYQKKKPAEALHALMTRELKRETANGAARHPTQH